MRRWFLVLLIVLLATPAFAQRVGRIGKGSTGRPHVVLGGGGGGAGNPSLSCPSTSATQSTAYSSTFTASGGTAPYVTYAISSGSLPTGLSLNTSTGAVTGTPTGTGASSFSGTVTDTASHTSSPASCSITVNPAGSFPSGSSCADPSDDSPTGRNALFISCDSMHNLKQAWTDYQANTSNPATVGGHFMKQMAEQCAATGTPYNAFNYSCALLYYITGTTSYAASAYSTIVADFYGASETDGNNQRNYLLLMVMLRDLLQPYLNSTQRSDFTSELDTWQAATITFIDRFEDSDQVTGGWFALALQHLLLGSTDATTESLWGTAEVGGFTATAENETSTWRNALKHYFNTLAAGGEWIESSMYNIETVQLALLGRQALLAATGVDYLPEMTTWLQSGALRNIYFKTLDLQRGMQWGDNQDPRENSPGHHWAYASTMFARATEGTSAGPYVQDFILDLIAQYGYSTSFDMYGSGAVAVTLQDMLTGYNGSATRGDTSTLPKTFYANGQGFILYRDGTATTDTTFFSHCLNTLVFIDHQNAYFCDLQSYAKGGYELTHPLTYLGPANFSGDGVNGFTNYGMYGLANEYRKITAQESGTSPEDVYSCATMGGSFNNSSTADMVPTWLHEATRCTDYLPSSNKASNTLITYHRFYAKRPQDQCNLGDPSKCFSFFYSSGLQTAINAEPRRWVTWHANADPTITGNSVAWTAENGRNVVVEAIYPAASTLTKFDESSSSTTFYQNQTGTTQQYPVYVVPLEQHWLVRIKETTATDFARYLQCFTAHDGITRSCTGVQSTDGTQDGVLVKRASLNDTLLMYNGRRGKLLKQPIPGVGYDSSNQAYLDCVRLLQTGYTVTWTSVSSTTDVILHDLDPAGTWTKAIDGAGATSLTVTSKGRAVLSLSGSGSHTIVIGGSGTGCAGGYGSEETGTNSIAFDAASAAAVDVSGSSNTLTGSITVGAGSNRALIVAPWSDATYTGSEACTFNGTPMTLVGRAQSGGRNIYAFRLTAPASGTHNWVCTFGSNAAMVGGAVSYTGVDQTTPINATQSISTLLASPFVGAVIPLRTNSWTIAATGNGFGLPGAGTGSTSRVVNANGYGLFDSGGPITTSGDTVTMEVTGGSNQGGVMIALNPLP